MLSFVLYYVFSFVVIGYISYIWIDIETLKNNSFKSAFLTYGLNDILTSNIVDEEEENFKEQLDNSETESPSPTFSPSLLRKLTSETYIKPVTNNKKDKQIFKIGDIIKISFSFLPLDDKDFLFRHRARRSISTYGFEEILPEENTEYIITNVEECGEIPNAKDRSNVEKSNNNMDCYIHVYPLKFLDKYDYDIFWFINLTNMTICQFEDAYPTDKLSCIFKVRDAEEAQTMKHIKEE
jgi:hypothetical protein